MLFSKKKQFAILEKQIKEELKDENGRTVLRLNLRYPELQCPKKDPLTRFAEPLYKKLAEGFAEYAKTELFKKAKALTNEDFMPFSALMRFEKAFEDERFLSILVEFSVSDGKTEAFTERKAQTWDRKSGTLCGCNDFLERKTIDALKKEHRKLFDKTLFVLRNNEIVFFVGDKTVSVPTDIKAPM